MQRSIRSRFRLRSPRVHVLTVHHREPRWVPIQRSFLERNLPRGYRVWAVVEGIEAADLGGIDTVMAFAGNHPERLNHLAEAVLAEAHPDDRLLFLDSDAWPVAPIEALARETRTLTAVRRRENSGDPQPHPCFALTTAAFWRDFEGDWRRGPRWQNDDGWSVTDPGARVLRRLERKGIEWRPLDRCNGTPHGLWFGLYGDAPTGPIVYHHGAGSRARVSRLDRQRALEARKGEPIQPGHGRFLPHLEADATQVAAQEALSDRALRLIRAHPRFWEQPDWLAPITRAGGLHTSPTGSDAA